MADFNEPTTSTDHDDALDILKARDVDALTMCGDAPTNPPEKAMKFDRATSTFKEWLSSVWETKVLGIAGGGTGATTASGARTALGLQSMATQAASAVAITGGTIAGTSQAASTITSGVLARERLASGAYNPTDYPAGDGTWRPFESGLLPGFIIPYGGSSNPSGWLLCDGSVVSRSTYSALFAIIGTTFGEGDGSTTFNLPDLRGRFPLGKAASGTGSVLGSSGGQIDHVHTGPSHTHVVDAHTHTGPSHTHSISASGTHTHTISSDGSHTHNVVGNTANTTVNHTHTFSGTTSGPSATASAYAAGSGNLVTINHTHNFSGTTAGTSSSTSHNHGVNIESSSGGSHTHGGATGAGGNHDHGGATGASGTGETGSASPETSASGTGDTGSANPPYLVVNYIIKV